MSQAASHSTSDGCQTLSAAGIVLAGDKTPASEVFYVQPSGTPLRQRSLGAHLADCAESEMLCCEIMLCACRG